jgi:hypothetical protein
MISDSLGGVAVKYLSGASQENLGMVHKSSASFIDHRLLKSVRDLGN